MLFIHPSAEIPAIFWQTVQPVLYLSIQFPNNEFADLLCSAQSIRIRFYDVCDYR